MIKQIEKIKKQLIAGSIDKCMYCGGDCEYNDKIEHNNYLCDGYEGDIDNLYNTNKQFKQMRKVAQ